MNQRTFNAWLRIFGYTWVEDEPMIKGFMTEDEARALANDFLAEGSLIRG